MKDREFLTWIHKRLEKVHGESPNVDYMHKLRAIIRATPLDQETPNISSEPKSVDSPPMLAVGHDELGGPVGEETACWICGGQHPVEYGEKVLDDGTKVPSKLLAFFRCSGKTYLCGIDGRSWVPPSGRRESEGGAS